jgi:hypothetical protein
VRVRSICQAGLDSDVTGLAVCLRSIAKAGQGVHDIPGGFAPGRRPIGSDWSSDSWPCIRTDLTAFAPVLSETFTNRFGLEVASLDGKSRARTRRVEGGERRRLQPVFLQPLEDQGVGMGR